MDVAGVVIGIAALWQSCVQVYGIFDSARQHGREFELLVVRFDVERIRLLRWGEAVGLNGVQTDGAAPTPGSVTAPNTTNIDVRFRRDDLRGVVLRLLGCIQHVFESTDRLRDNYGLQPSPPASTGQDQDNMPHSLGAVFRQPYANLRHVSAVRQRTTPLTRRTVWAVRDRRKFEVLVRELREFNDSLESLFPDAQARAAAAMRAEIERSKEVRELALLQEATAEDHRELSEVASLRLEELGATVSARTELLSVSRRRDEVGNQTAAENAAPGGSDGEMQPDDDPQGEGQTAPAGRVAPEEEMANRLEKMQECVESKRFGALILRLNGPFDTHVSVSVFRLGFQESPDVPSYRKGQGEDVIPVMHAAFERYKRKKYMLVPPGGEHESPDEEDLTLLDPESHYGFENDNPGTVSTEGFGLECWDIEASKPSNRDNSVLVSGSELPQLRGRTLLRRMNDMQNRSGSSSRTRDEQEFDLNEVVGTLGWRNPEYAKNEPLVLTVGALYMLLNRTDVVADFTTISTVGSMWAKQAGPQSLGVWNFLRQIIVGRELAIRLGRTQSLVHTGFTQQILASLIISELWLKHVRVAIADVNLSQLGNLKGADTAEQRAKAEDFKNRGNEALKRNEHQKAADLYTEAIRLDATNPIYSCNRSAALVALGMYREAEQDAYMATLFDSNYAKAWSRLGMAMFKQEDAQRARKAYQRAIQVAGGGATTQMRRGLACAEELIEQKIKAIQSEEDAARRHGLHSAYLDEEWETSCKTIKFHSLIHEQQVEGLLLFAERMGWPHINETREYAEDVYTDALAGRAQSIHLHDWLYGIVLPGKWFAFKIMTALILCTPSIRDKLADVLPRYDCGVILPTRSYWRLRTALGRVLGGLPGVASLCGWIGPCPEVEFEPPEERPAESRYICLRARQIALMDHIPRRDEDALPPIIIRDPGAELEPQPRPDDEMESFVAEVLDSRNWVVPEPPVQDMGTCEVVSIRLKKLAPRMEVTRNGIYGPEDQNAPEYRANVTFKLDDNREPIVFQLFTNPVFVTPPRCVAPQGPHAVHMRELHRYQDNVWPVERLKDHTTDDWDNEKVMVINATRKGAEVLARAWCSERGKCAVIRRRGGPCFVCAVRAASKPSLGTGVLIWAD